ncbi:MAG: ribosome recycling factor [Planctomycetes bacterium]|nr:ribosome recycling factor [Planctomycetota bacterium]
MDYNATLAETKERMKKGVAHFQEQIRGLRSGRATPALVENIRVEYYGSPTPLKQIASIAIPEPRTLVVRPFDPSVLKEIEKAVQKSELGINPQSDGKVVRLTVPDMSEEQRGKLVARVKDLAEQGRVALRNLRRELNKKVEDGDLGEDDRTTLKDEIQKALKSCEGDIEKILAAKTKEIMET